MKGVHSQSGVDTMKPEALKKLREMMSNPKYTNTDIADAFSVSEAAVRRWRKKLNIKSVKKEITADDIVLKEREGKEKRDSRKEVKILSERLESLEQENAVLKEHNAQTLKTYTISPNKGNESEATAFIIGSDWHIEERVRAEEVNGVNEYNLETSKERADKFFANARRLVSIARKDSKVERVVLALLGDMITNNIHDELKEIALLSPALAILRCEEYIVSGINHLLEDKETKELVVVCTTGNHGRITKERRHATEQGNSLEHIMYHAIASNFKDNSRVKFVINEAYHTYLDVYEATIRFHHGHNIGYGGGIGGMTIPINKKISKWNQLRKADLDVMGHFHQLFDGGNFIVNGSLIGYNAYALAIGASPEKPQQSFFLWVMGRGKTMVCPIWVD